MDRDTFCKITGNDGARIDALRRRDLLPFGASNGARARHSRLNYTIYDAICLAIFDHLTIKNRISLGLAAKICRELEKSKSIMWRFKLLRKESPWGELWLLWAVPAKDDIPPFFHVGPIEECFTAMLIEDNRERIESAQYSVAITANIGLAFDDVIERGLRFGIDLTGFRAPYQNLDD